MSASSYVLARLSNPETLLDAVTAIEECGAVSRWHAVDGHVNLVLKLNTPSAAIPDRIRNLGALGELTVYDVVRESPARGPMKNDASYAFVFIETDRVNRDRIRILLEGWNTVQSCEETAGGCDLVILLGGDNFIEIDRIVRDAIQPLDGVLRVKVDKVINLERI